MTGRGIFGHDMLQGVDAVHHRHFDVHGGHVRLHVSPPSLWPPRRLTQFPRPLWRGLSPSILDRAFLMKAESSTTSTFIIASLCDGLHVTFCFFEEIINTFQKRYPLRWGEGFLRRQQRPIPWSPCVLPQNRQKVARSSLRLMLFASSFAKWDNCGMFPCFPPASSGR